MLLVSNFITSIQSVSNVCNNAVFKARASLLRPLSIYRELKAANDNKLVNFCFGLNERNWEGFSKVYKDLCV